MSSPNGKGYAPFDHDLHARSRPPDDFWGQVRRTVKGQPVPAEQIEMIVAAAVSALELGPEDVVLDLACGNGALSARMFDRCAELVGVDSSEYLVSVAKANFERSPQRLFLLDDVAAFARGEPRPERFTKVLCYGSFSYFSEEIARAVLRLLAERFVAVSRVYIGNLPDRARSASFYTVSPALSGELDDPRSQIGIWRSMEEFRGLAASCGWKAEFRNMPAAFYASHYRYDALLSRPR